MRGIKTWFFGLLTGAAVGAGAYYLLREGLPKDMRERVSEAVTDAADNARKAAAETKVKLEERLDELVGVNGKH